MGDIIQFPQNKNKPPKPYTYKPEEVTVDNDNIIQVNFQPNIKNATFEETVREIISSVITGVTGEEVPCKCTLSSQPNEKGNYILTNNFIMLKDYITPTNHRFHITEKPLQEASKFLQESNTGILTWKQMNSVKNRPACYNICLAVELSYIELKSVYGDLADEMIGNSYTLYFPRNQQIMNDEWTAPLEHDLEGPDNDGS